MKLAIFSDIHNHSAALKVVLNHAQKQGVDAFYCLGDVGIESCVELVQAVGAPTVFGNWELSNWRLLEPNTQQWILSLPPMIKQDQLWLTHAAPFWPPKIRTLADLLNNDHVRVKGKLFPYLNYDEESLWQTVATLSEVGVSVMFHGHTHRQLAWRFTASNHFQRLSARKFGVQPGDTLVVGVGSVGRPHDGPGACYAIYDDEARTVEMMRVKV